MQSRLTPSLLVALALTLCVCGVVLIASRDVSESKPDNYGEWSSEDTTTSAETPTRQSSKSDRPEVTKLDAGGFIVGTPEWLETEAGKHWAASLPEDKLKNLRHTELVENLSLQGKEELLKRLEFRMFAKENPKVGYVKKSAVSTWQEARERVMENIAFGLSRNPLPKVHVDPNYYLFSSRREVEFSSGYAVRKRDGAIYHWEVLQVQTFNPYEGAPRER